MKLASRVLILTAISAFAIAAFMLNQKLDMQIQKLDAMNSSIASLKSQSAVSEPDLLPAAEELHTAAEVENRFAALGSSASVSAFAKTLAEVDDWLIEPQSSKRVELLLGKYMNQLRQSITEGVKNKHLVALAAKTGSDAAKAFNDAGAAIAVFPMGESPDVIEKARSLTTAHRNVGLKIELAKRVRYNQWAVKRIEQAIEGYHARSSFLSPKKENSALITSLVTHLGTVDPNHLEPIVLSLYNYVVELTKDSVSESDKISLAKGLTAQTRRSHPDDF